ncbi:HEAT repeat domain-containing protein [Alienimonas californiensis]|uniref:HEAT repeat protein n=1 Tax=Alienimonas californiensis TaxID=2527989 RepID=A0A517P8A2_9PLAN|nr:HEAT repeat domain-containing protein [Alienimonas californiensis]QDT15575.1 HEAT repeat protein [Alienimonas californiensis]
MSAALCLALLAAAPPDDGVDWVKATPQEWAVRLSVASGFGEERNGGDFAEALQELAALGPRAREAALLEILAEGGNPAGRRLYDADKAVEALAVDGVPAVIAAIVSDRAWLRKVGWRAAGRLFPRENDAVPADPALATALIAVAEPGLSDADRAVEFLEAEIFLNRVRGPAVHVALTLFDHPAPRVRSAAAEAIAVAFRRDNYRPNEEPPLSASDAAARAAGIRALRLAATDDPDPAVRTAAVESLTRLGAGSELVLDHLLVRVLAFGSESGSREVGQLFAALQALSRYPEHAAEARTVLAPHAREAVPENPREFFAAGENFEWGPDAFGFERAVGLLVQDETWRKDAIDMLGWMGPAASSELPRLVPLLGEAGAAVEANSDRWDEGEFRLFVAQTVAKIDPGHPALPDLVFPRIPEIPEDLPNDLPAEATPAERKAWLERWKKVERALWRPASVLWAMGPHAAPALPQLRPHLTRYRSERPNTAVVLAVAGAGPLPDDLLPIYAAQGHRFTVHETQWVLRSAGARALPALAAALAVASQADAEVVADPDAGMFSETIEDLYRSLESATVDRSVSLKFRLESLTKMRPADLAERRDVLTAAIVPLTRDEDLMVQGWALAALQTVRPDDPAAFLAAAADDDPRIRGAAVRALGAYGEEESVKPVLATALKDRYATVRLPAIRAWRAAGFDEESLGPLRDDPNPAVRLAARDAGAAGA